MCTCSLTFCLGGFTDSEDSVCEIGQPLLDMESGQPQRCSTNQDCGPGYRCRSRYCCLHRMGTCLSVFLSVCLSPSVCCPLSVSVRPFVCLSVCQSACLPACLPACLSLSLSVCVSGCLSLSVSPSPCNIRMSLRPLLFLLSVSI